ncbi:hypothetical protein GCM10008942_05930 [Rhizomicrobium electricum]|uniref:DUF3551 domain-containing protein n=1 Tax=Rhizomicrobium electricum TaxID=480070 RepID=A0ABP3P680_9PROT
MAWKVLIIFSAVVLAVLEVSPAAHADKAQKPDAVEGKCNDKNGVYFPPKGGHSYGCLYPDGSGIVCGGSKKGCDSWPATRALNRRPLRAKELGMPEKPTHK